LQLAFRLLDIGVIERGRFTFIQFQHDDQCAALRTNSALDCRCDPWAVIGERTYVYSDIVQGRAQ
jgi:hypothetical protein